MSVDLPAPLSPSRHMTSPRDTLIETSSSAVTLSKLFEMLRTSMSGVLSAGVMSGSAGADGALAHEAVDQHRDQEHGAEYDLEPVRVDARENDALAHHAEKQRPEHRADGGAVAAGQEGAAHDYRDNREKLLAGAAQHVGAGERHGLNGGHQARRRGCADEQRDLDAIH